MSLKSFAERAGLKRGPADRTLVSDMAIAAAVTAGTLLCLLILNLLTATVDRSVYRQRAQEAVEDGTFAAKGFFPFGKSDQAPARFNHNDCGILSMLALEPRDNVLRRSLSPMVPTSPAAEKDARVPPHEACWRFVSVLRDPQQPAEYYHRYVHGHWTFAAVLLPFMSFWELTSGLMLLSAGLALCTSVVAGMKLLQGTMSRHRAFAYMVIGMAGSLLIPLNDYGRSVSFAFSDIVMLAFLLLTCLRPLTSMSNQGFVIAVAFFGSATAAMEFLTGAAPAALALLLGCLALDPSPDARLLVRRAIKGAVYFFASAALTVLLKWLAVGLAWDWGQVVSAGEKLLGWTQESRWTITLWAFPELHQLWELGYRPEQVQQSRLLTAALAFLRLVNHSSSMGYGSQLLGWFLVAGAPVLLLLWGAAGGVIGGGNAYRARSVLLLLAATILITWHVMFVHHSILHAYFMQRPFLWLAVLLLGWGGWNLGRRTVGAAAVERPDA